MDFNSSHMSISSSFDSSKRIEAEGGGRELGRERKQCVKNGIRDWRRWMNNWGNKEHELEEVDEDVPLMPLTYLGRAVWRRVVLHLKIYQKP